MLSFLLAATVYAAPLTNLCSEPIENSVLVAADSEILVFASEERYGFLGRKFASAAQFVTHDGEILGVAGAFRESKRYRVHEQKVYKHFTKEYGEPIVYGSDTFMWAGPDQQVASLLLAPGHSSIFMTCNMFED